MDDIFINKHPDEDYLDVPNDGDNNFFDDLLNDGVQNVIYFLLLETRFVNDEWIK